VSVELVAESRHDPFYYSDGETFPVSEDADRYEAATRVEGTANVGDGEDKHGFEDFGERDHSWGRREWVGEAEWLWISGAFEDGTAFNHLSFWLSEYPDQRIINGFWYDGDETPAHRRSGRRRTVLRFGDGAPVDVWRNGARRDAGPRMGRRFYVGRCRCRCDYAGRLGGRGIGSARPFEPVADATETRHRRRRRGILGEHVSAYNGELSVETGVSLKEKETELRP
jgi:hypothetical protein